MTEGNASTDPFYPFHMCGDEIETTDLSFLKLNPEIYEPWPTLNEALHKKSFIRVDLEFFYCKCHHMWSLLYQDTSATIFKLEGEGANWAVYNIILYGN